MGNNKIMNRRDFIVATATTVAGLRLASPMASVMAQQTSTKKRRLAIVGTGIRAIDMWGKDVLRDYGDSHQFVGLCDINPGRAQFAEKYIGTNCPTFTDFEKMVNQTRPDAVIVTTVDAYHDRYIVKGMEMGCDIITEKPMTTDEVKCQSILDAERKTGRNCIVTFNYRYSPHREKIKELLMEKAIGQITSVDFHWYLDVYHGAAYFRRWHRLREKSGTLLVHKATHHYDLLNWWLDSEPKEVVAYGDLEFYGKNNSFRSTHCRSCQFQQTCQFYWDITTNKKYMDLYVANEKYDGYLRDGCVWKEDINIYDKMAVQIKYANNVQVSYSLTTYSPYEGYRIAFNGTKGRLEAWIQERQPWQKKDYDELRLTTNFGKTELIKIARGGGGDDISFWTHKKEPSKKTKAGWGHGGGDVRLKDKIFKNPSMPDPLKQSAGTRDGAMSILVGIAARKSIETGKPIKITELTDLKPQPRRPV
jgi:predicted dehydrogenase